MNQEVSAYIEKLPEWQQAICDNLRKMVSKTIPAAEERMQYGKPQYLKNGHYACLYMAAKDKVSFMIFNAGDLQEIKGFFKSMSDPGRKTATIKEGDTVDYKQLAALLKQASASL